MSVTDKSPLQSTYDPVCWNFKLLAQHELDGFGGMGEGMSMQIAPDGRRIIWLAHESAPKNFTAVDVSDPRKPKMVVQTDLPQSLHALELARDHRQRHGGRLSVPEGRAEAGRLRAVRHLDAGKAAVDRVLRLRRARIRAACTSSGSATANTCTWRPARADFKPTHPLDDQFYRIFDVRNPSKPVEVGRWWLPGTREGDNAPPPARHPKPLSDKGNPRPQHQRLSAAAGPLLSRLYRRRHDHPRHLRQVEAEAALPLGQLAALSPASPTRCCRCSSATCWS